MSTCTNGHVDPPRFKNGNCKSCQYSRNKEVRSTQWKKRNARLKSQAIRSYGGKCSCCGESREVFLAIDHIEDNGREHRKIITGKDGRTGAGYQTYKWLEKNNYPDGFQVLCHNCNFAKTRGVCPHQEEDT